MNNEMSYKNWKMNALQLSVRSSAMDPVACVIWCFN